MKKLIGVIVLSLTLAIPAWAVTTLILVAGSSVTALTTELNSLTNNSWTAASSAINNASGQTLAGYTLCRVEFVGTYAANPTAGGAITGWFLTAPDGTNYENTPTSSVGLNRLPDFVVPATTGQTGTRVSILTWCPTGLFKVVVQNTASGQTLAASGNTVKIFPATLQGS